MLKYFVLLSALLIISCGEKDQSEAHAFARAHYDMYDFFHFYEDFNALFNDSNTIYPDFLFGYDSLSLYNTYYNNTPFAEEDFYCDITYNSFVQGWDDCEPVFNSKDGFVLDSSTYTYFYTYFNADTTWLVNRYSKSDSSLLEKGIFGYSRNCGKYREMLLE
jgi:hypothetical protein